jgi:hypothetical protein
MNINGVQLSKKALKTLRLMQSNDSEQIALYLSAIDRCEDVLLTPSGILPEISDADKLETLALMRYLKKDLTTLISISDE